MKKILLAGLMVVAMAGVVRADEPALVNDPGNAWDNIKQVLQTADPSADAMFDFLDGRFHKGASIRLYSAERLTIPVVNDLDLRLGWFDVQGVKLGLALDLERATGNVLLHHATIGWYGGRDFDESKWVSGPEAGVRW